MVGSDEKFLIDANTLITASRLYYAHDLIPTFWKLLASKAEEGKVCILDIVKKEICKGEDWLKGWLDSGKLDFQICNHVDSEIITKYAEVMQYIQTCGYYNANGLNGWARNDVADPWLIAAAAAKDYTLITFEQPAGFLSNKNKSGKVKIPDVAKHFNVRVHNLYYMMRQLGISI